jgi:hypothetical protein
MATSHATAAKPAKPKPSREDLAANRFYKFLKTNHENSQGPSQRMKDAVMLYNKTVIKPEVVRG